MKTKKKIYFYTDKGFKVQRDQIRRVSRLLGIRDREAKDLLAQTTYEGLKDRAELYHKIRMRIGLNHPDMRTFLSERRPYHLKEIAEGLNIPT